MKNETEYWAHSMSDPLVRERYSRYVQKADREIGSFLSFNTSGYSQVQGPLKSIPVGVKDNIAVKGWPLTCASAILKDFVSPYTATAVKNLEDAGAFVVGKTDMDEFGMGSSGQNSALGKTVNPWNTGKVPGGSSGGSAAAVTCGFVPLALGSDTGGSVRQPASFCGIYGLKPTYGSVSRYGLTAYASSLEVIGLLSGDLELMEKSFDLMSGSDSCDQSSMDTDSQVERSARIEKKQVIAMLDMDMASLDDAVSESCTDCAQALQEMGYEVRKVKIPSMEMVIPAYYTIATAEASANLARYCGVRYGLASMGADNPDVLMRRSRHDGFGSEVKLRILLGTYVLRSGFHEQYYIKAQKVRTLIRRQLDEILSVNHLLLMPVFPTQAFGQGDQMDHYQQRLGDIYTCLANLAGLPAFALPTGLRKGLPSGVQFMAPLFRESFLFDMARRLSAYFPVEWPERKMNLESLA